MGLVETPKTAAYLRLINFWQPTDFIAPSKILPNEIEICRFWHKWQNGKASMSTVMQVETKMLRSIKLPGVLGRRTGTSAR